MMVGVQGSGKTTLTQRWGLPLVCTDSIRAQLTGDPTDQSMNDFVWRSAREKIKALLHQRGVAVLDACNTRPDLRADFLAEVCTPQTHRVAIVVATPLSVCLERNKCRDRQVPEWLIRNYFDQLQCGYHDLYRQFDEVFLVTTT